MIQLSGKAFIARHGETVFNSAKRMQGALLHTPLTRAGMAQAEKMGADLAALLGKKPPLELWSSPTGRALQTLAIIAEHLELDWHEAHQDARLAEIGMGGWDGKPYAEIEAEHGAIFDRDLDVFVRTAPDGEDYAAVAGRLTPWIADQTAPRDRLIVMHGASSQVLRGLLVGGRPHPVCGTIVAPRLPQGSVAMIENGRETIVVTGSGAN
ncbi:MAG TPA: histidine phosphatase family protein [Sphingomonas sp.]|jgi:probable phosphoglycerate mutase|nr:histidine phosphatase family protein [Sphingomonas sp.]